MMKWHEGPPAKLLPVPYVSQEREGALKFNNDCGAAAAAMLIRDYTDQEPTPDELFKRTGAKTDRFLTASEIMALLRLFGIHSEWQVGFKRGDLFDTLITRRPVITLIKYGILRDAGLTESRFGGPHFSPVVGMDTGISTSTIRSGRPKVVKTWPSRSIYLRMLGSKWDVTQGFLIL